MYSQIPHPVNLLLMCLLNLVNCLPEDLLVKLKSVFVRQAKVGVLEQFVIVLQQGGGLCTIA